MVKGKTKNAGEEVRTDWSDPTELKAFCDICAAQVLAGQRKGGWLTKKGVNVVIAQLAEMGKAVTYLKVKNKWDHLKGRWKIWKDISQHATGLGYDPTTGLIDAPDDWWEKKIEQNKNAKTLRNKGLPHIPLLDIMFDGTVATGKRAWTPGQTPNAHTEGSGDSEGSKEFVDPQCETSVDADPMSVEAPSVSRLARTVDKGKGLARGVQLFKGVGKRRHRRPSIVEEMGANLKSLTDVIIESRSASTRTPPANAAPTSVEHQVMAMVLSLPGVQMGDRLHMFSTLYFMGNGPAMQMFLTLSSNQDVQLKWLEKQYDGRTDLW